MNLRERNIFNDWHTGARRKARLSRLTFTERIARLRIIIRAALHDLPTIVALAQGALILALVGIFAWLLWVMTGPQAMAFFYKLAGG